MKNKNGDDIISLILVIVSLTLMFIVFPILGAFGYTKLVYFGFGAIVLVFYIRYKLISWNDKKKEKERNAFYGFDKEEKDNFTSYFPKEDKDNLIELTKLISNNKITNYDFITTCIENKDEDGAVVNFFENMEYIVTIDWKEELKEVVGVINNLCRKLDYNVSLSESDITEKDDQYIKNRRKDGIVSTLHDLNVATSILRKQGYEIICLWSDGDAYNISIIPVNKIEEMKKIKNI